MVAIFVTDKKYVYDFEKEFSRLSSIDLELTELTLFLRYVRARSWLQ